MVPHIRDVESPEIGRYYRVPCVKQRERGALVWVPILGPPHTDADLGVEEEHWHYDLRFVGASLWRRLFPLREEGDPYALATVLTTTAGHNRTDRRLRCVRQMPEFPAIYRDNPGACVQVLKLLEPQYRDVRLRPGCRTCPHRGFPLKDGAKQPDGTVICAGHGLRWDLTTGRMVSRCGEAGELMVADVLVGLSQGQVRRALAKAGERL